MKFLLGLCKVVKKYVPNVLLLLLVANAMLLLWLFGGQTFGLIAPGGGGHGARLVLSLGWATFLVLLLVLGRWLVEVLPTRPPSVYLVILGRLSVYGSFIGLFIVLYTLVPTLVFYVSSAERTSAFSQWYFALDTRLGVYELFPTFLDGVRAIPWLYNVIDISYTHTMTALIVLTLLLPVASFQQAYKLMLGIVVTLLLSVPMWLAAPALAPLQLALTDTLSSETLIAQTAPIRTVYETRSETTWGTQTGEWIAMWERVHTEGFGYAISANPSMHMAWGVLIVMFLWRVAWWAGLLALPFLVFEAIGTILFLQHYVIDIPVGILVGFVSVWIVDRYGTLPEQSVQRFWFSPMLWLNRFGRRLRLRQLD
ncbi:phosphatase PAP2 family protein [Candidatus Kaiserbacteria bacterium]|nr:phosphatase PAP2 family protein [Candidatus Kaiserbacteria bacterium]